MRKQAVNVDAETLKPHGSVWPIALAATLTIAVVGLMVNVTIAVVGAVLSVAAIILWVTQRFHGPGAMPEGHTGEVGATPTAQKAAAEAALPVRSSNWWGMVWFIATEATFFAFLIAGYVYLRAVSPVWPPPGTPKAELLFPSINTVILLLSGVPAYFAQGAIRNGNQKGLRVGLLLSALLGAIFLAGQVYEYATASFGLTTSVFGAGFFVLTGFHGAHVLAGITMLLVALVMSLGGRFSPEHHFGVEFASTYWHFVDLVWILLFTVLYLAR